MKLIILDRDGRYQPGLGRLYQVARRMEADTRFTASHCPPKPGGLYGGGRDQPVWHRSQTV